MDKLLNYGKLKIVKADPEREVGTKGAKMVSFQAVNEAGITEKYSTFKTVLFPQLKDGATIDAEWEVSETTAPNGTVYTNRTVVNVTVAGVKVVQPTQSKTFSGGSAGKQWGKTPEQMATERTSIERQVAAKLALEFALGKTLDETLANAEKIAAWIGKNPPAHNAPVQTQVITGVPNTEIWDDKPASKQTPCASISPDNLNIDMDWLKVSMKAIKWTDKTAVDYIKSNINKTLTPTALLPLLMACNKEEREKFVTKIIDLHKMAG